MSRNMRNSSTSKTFIVTDPVFGVDIMVALGGTTENALKKFCKKIGEPAPPLETNDRRRGWVFSHNKSGAPVLIWLHESAWAGIVAHEVFHAVVAILANKQVQLVAETEEVYAYHIEWLFNQIAPKLPGWRIKK